ncbi:uncharacterized protein LOC144576540 isoform X2 [Callithrix jacchus]
MTCSSGSASALPRGTRCARSVRVPACPCAETTALAENQDEDPLEDFFPRNILEMFFEICNHLKKLNEHSLEILETLRNCKIHIFI